MGIGSFPLVMGRKENAEKGTDPGERIQGKLSSLMFLGLLHRFLPGIGNGR